MFTGTPPKGRHIIRDRHGVRTNMTEPPARMAVAWRTFITRDMLNATQQATLEAIEPHLEHVLGAMERDWMMGRGMPEPDRLPVSAYQELRRALTPFMRAWRDSAAEGFDTLFPVDRDTGGGPADDELAHQMQTKREAAFEASRTQLWPSALLG